MAVNQRTRFEVFKRDGFRCYYCGVRGNETSGEGLTIDHVVPVSLGGTDDAMNLVSACRDCNFGKASVPADAPLIADVDEATARYTAARALALKALEADLEAQAEYMNQVWDEWDQAFPEHSRDNRDVESFGLDWFKRGVPILLVGQAFRIAQAGPARRAEKVRYAGGVVNNLMRDAEDRTRALSAGDDVVRQDGWSDGFGEGLQAMAAIKNGIDMVQRHIDQQKLTYYDHPPFVIGQVLRHDSVELDDAA